MSTATMVRAERIHQEAVAEHAAAEAQAQQNADRLADAKARMSVITDKRVNGKSSPAEAAEFAALQGDATLLQTMLDAANAAKTLAHQKKYQAYVAYSDAEREHAQELAQAKYDALKAKAIEIESVFIQAVGAVGDAASAIGIRTIGQAYPKSTAIRNLFDLNISPGKK